MEASAIAVRGRVELAAGFADRVRAELASKLAHAASLIERGSVRFEDVNGPRGGVDIVCRIKLVLSGRPSIHVTETAASPEAAFANAVPVVARALERIRDKHVLRPGRHRRRTVDNLVLEPSSGPNVAADSGEIIGRRVGRGSAALERALERPEKLRRDIYVDTSLPGISESHRKACGTMSARRNARANPSRGSATLEDSRTKPSRKSTRRNANRGKPSHGKERLAASRSLTPSARKARAAARR
jgi:hypothetical protein